MSAKLADFAQRYRQGFDEYLRDRDERALASAYELGRAAVAQQLNVLDLATAHHDALLSRMSAGTDAMPPQELIQASRDFFLESVTAFDIVQRALQEAREAARVEWRHAMLLRQLSTFLADASLALDASGSLAEMLQLVAEHARELTGAERSAVSLTLSDETWRVEAPVLEQRETALDSRLDELASLYHALRSPGGRLRMTGTDLQRHLDPETLAGAADATWKPRGWLVAPLTALDGRDLGLIQAFDKHAGEFSELDEATLVQLAQMASAAVERAELYRQVR